MKQILDTPNLQAAWLGPLKKGVPFFQNSRTLDGHTWIRIGPLLMTDCTCMNLGTGEPRE